MHKPEPVQGNETKEIPCDSEIETYHEIDHPILV